MGTHREEEDVVQIRIQFLSAQLQRSPRCSEEVSKWPNIDQQSERWRRRETAPTFHVIKLSKLSSKDFSILSFNFQIGNDRGRRLKHVTNVKCFHGIRLGWWRFDEISQSLAQFRIILHFGKVQTTFNWLKNNRKIDLNSILKTLRTTETKHNTGISFYPLACCDTSCHYFHWPPLSWQRPSMVEYL